MKFFTKKSIQLLILLFLAAGTAFAAYLGQQEQDLRQQASSSLAIGFNLPGGTHYGDKNILNATELDHIDKDLREIYKMGGTVVRVFAAHNSISDEEAARRLDVFLTKAAGYRISVIVSFIDYYGPKYNPQGTDQFYTDTFRSLRLLNHSFYEDGYKNRYKSFVRTIVERNKSHSNIYAWEPGNELKDKDSPETFANFMRDITAYIKSVDPNHDIATGMINAAHAGFSPSELYSTLPNVNVITIRSRDGDFAGNADVEWAVANGKKAVVEELGVKGTDDRTDRFRTLINYWKGKGVTAVLQWGFMAKGITENGENGDGDAEEGMDVRFHAADYDKLFNMYREFTGGGNPDPTNTPPMAATATPPAAVTTAAPIAPGNGKVVAYLAEINNPNAAVQNLTLKTGDRKSLRLYLDTGTANVMGFEFKITFANNLQLTSVDDGEAISEAKFNKTLFRRNPSDGSHLHFSAYTTNISAAIAGKLHLATLNFTALSPTNGSTIQFSYSTVPSLTTVLTVEPRPLSYVITGQAVSPTVVPPGGGTATTPTPTPTNTRKRTTFIPIPIPCVESNGKSINFTCLKFNPAP